MHVRTLDLVDFRSYARAQLELTPGTTLFVGPNGRGKTNLVEAVAYLSTLGSHRVSSDAPLVHAGAERAVIRAGIDRAGRQTRIELEITPGRANRARVNGSPVRRTADLLGVLRTVLFAPEDLDLVKGDPAGRRAFLDSFLVACAPRWAAVRSDYERIVRQRTALLRAGGRSASRYGGPGAPGEDHELATLDSWDDHLVRVGAQLIAGRVWAVGLLGPRLRLAYDVLAGVPSGAAGDRPRFAAESAPAVQVPADGAGDGPARSAGAVLRCRALDAAGLDIAGLTDRPVDAAAVHAGTDPEVLAAAEGGLRSELAARRGDEIDRGQCLVGPHRDDLHLTVGALPARGYASHGESWSVALALRLASFEVLRRRIDDGGDPVLLLDDVFAELDDARRERLADLICDAEQVLVTAAVAEDVPAVLRRVTGGGTVGASRFAVDTGQVTRAA